MILAIFEHSTSKIKEVVDCKDVKILMVRSRIIYSVLNEVTAEVVQSSFRFRIGLRVWNVSLSVVQRKNSFSEWA